MGCSVATGDEGFIVGCSTVTVTWDTDGAGSNGITTVSVTKIVVDGTSEGGLYVNRVGAIVILVFENMTVAFEGTAGVRDIVVFAKGGRKVMFEEPVGSERTSVEFVKGGSIVFEGPFGKMVIEDAAGTDTFDKGAECVASGEFVLSVICGMVARLWIELTALGGLLEPELVVPVPLLHTFE